jgi:pyruvate dehydrogenase E1 component alpha subunit
MTPLRKLDPGTFPLRKVLTGSGEGLLPGFPRDIFPSDKELLAIFRAMLTTRFMDDRMLKLQRQGRVAFVGTSAGQEGAIHGSAAAFQKEDWFFSALREGGVALQRGMPVQEYVAHMFGNAEDTAKGRQMPNHFQCKDVNFPSWSSVLGTQMPHAVGVALAMKARGEKSVVGAYTGDGATSSCGFHSALNFAAVRQAPVVFVVVDNGWAISVPSSKQTASQSYGAKAQAYGMPGVDVDGNDPLAALQATQEAVDRARAGDGPSLVALRTYRMGGHSSSDDPERYRSAEEVRYWESKDPLPRMERFLQGIGVLDDRSRTSMEQEILEVIKNAVQHAEQVGPPPLASLVEDVFEIPPRHLLGQVVDALRLVEEKGAADAVEGKFPL